MSTKNKRLQLETREKIKDLWLAGLTEAKIAEKLSMPRSTVHVYVAKIEREMLHYMDEDTFLKYIAEFSRTRATFDREIEEIDEMIDKLDINVKEDKAVIARLVDSRHQIRLDKVKILQDLELPLAVKKFKKERDEMHSKLVTLRVEDDTKLILPEVTPSA